ncbi:brain acid soluble protein 1 homolog [Corythoichthys intestinalis]|uniref:brain acid soluble protein 1 homolog n=1 Tax=Corythoichthys intestinalis TaxID=161448 RepID=UPI0025A6298A|nr:brain acid soluble protein 1 homolog [Corythoichthys intestinalis]XP_057712651.1 brain acid soluble protein 1 homolog [Corythoichthys intestinalis]XP_061795218.1 brain acid soluble protein 1 homolog [Nerophis lumbriciformis]
MGGKLSKKKKGYNVNDDKAKEQDAKAAEGTAPDDDQATKDGKDGPAAVPAESNDVAPAGAKEPEKEADAEPKTDGEAKETPAAAAPPKEAPAVKDEADAKKTEAPKAEAEPPKPTAAPEAPPKDASEAPNKDQSKDQSVVAQE